MFEDDDLDGLDFGETPPAFTFGNDSNINNNNSKQKTTSSPLNNNSSSNDDKLHITPPPSQPQIKLIPKAAVSKLPIKPIIPISSSQQNQSSQQQQPHNNNSNNNKVQTAQPTIVGSSNTRNEDSISKSIKQQQQPQHSNVTTPQKTLYFEPMDSQPSQYMSDALKTTDYRDLLLNHRQQQQQQTTPNYQQNINKSLKSNNISPNSTNNNNNSNNQDSPYVNKQINKQTTPPKAQTLYKDNNSDNVQTPIKRIKNDNQNPVHVLSEQQHYQHYQQQENITTTPGRKFPGPAGSLPPLNPGQKIPNHSISTKILSNNNNNIGGSNGSNGNHDGVNNNSTKKQSVFLKANIQDFSNYDMFPVDYCRGPWVLMLKQRGLPPFGSAIDNPLLLKYNIDYVLREGYQKKVPLLVVMIKSLVATESNYETVISDPSGEMKGSIQKKIVCENFPELANGWILVLKKTSIFNPTPTSHYVNIVLSNIEYVFSPEDPLIQESNIEFDNLVNNSIEIYDPKSIYQAIPIRTPEQIEKELMEKKIAKKLKAESLNQPKQPMSPPPPVKKSAKSKPKAKVSSTSATNKQQKKATAPINSNKYNSNKNDNDQRDNDDEEDSYLTPPHSPKDIDNNNQTKPQPTLPIVKSPIKPIQQQLHTTTTTTPSQSSQGATASKKMPPPLPFKTLVPLVSPIKPANSSSYSSSQSSQSSQSTPLPLVLKPKPLSVIKPPLLNNTNNNNNNVTSTTTPTKILPPSSYFATTNQNNNDNNTKTVDDQDELLDFDFGDTSDIQPQQLQQQQLPSRTSLPTFERKFTPTNTLKTTFGNTNK